ncbi:MAG: response regulator transcription factor [Bacteroidota bacterium]
MKKVLVIEDDPAIAELVVFHLKDINFETRHTASGMEGLSLARSGGFDLCILDLMLPDMNGMDICRQLRMEKVQMPIIMLTARSEEIDKVLGLEIGADDYITKPFSVREFTARVKAVMRRLSAQPETPANAVLEFDELKIEVENRITRLHGQRIELTPKEFDLLVLLAKHPGRSYTRGQLLNAVWGYEFEGYEHTVNSHINRLRNKIEQDASAPKFILTTWGVGYRFNDGI